MVNNKQQVDVLIVGGGLAGCLSALALSRLKTPSGKPLTIAIIEASDVHTNSNQEKSALHFDSRVLALSHGSASYLKTLDVWQAIQSQAAAIDTIHISDHGHYGKARIYAHEHQVNALGYVIEMATLGEGLVKALGNAENVSWFAPNKVENIHWHSTHVDVQLDDQQLLQAALILGCDGGQSKCRKFANIDVVTKSYQQTAIIANVRFEKPHQHIAYERFTEHGPLAILPLTDQDNNGQKCSLVWTTTPEHADYLSQLPNEGFAEQLNQTFGHWLGSVEHVGKRESYPLDLVKANEQVFHRMVLVGNASHTIHPIAGQGFNLGLRDVSELADMIAEQLVKNEDIATFSKLSQYAVKRSKDHQQIIGLTDSLVTLFSNKHAPLIVGRNVGLKVLNYCQSLKNSFVSKTMGY
ncbi:2-octaprenyl-6-methoxyphenyl hydroxylase [Thalassotalea sp. 1_MG-2023]|uniref:2-octaprenyl-6-methoxyphenyl hydroxylase n=1 Tax=Thalassotalea sp. 1_MG-2023 TaxID=3062680 RepID=UPI0026E15C44|nr:2-octaprenyl-6-methoxyphenyl hydroxylase [Thalassotalea sp. 1_MG-2023]MDO6426797.1 2-octaprenyl-6-methoxyphenyl hydroxylase [Thalassotalea sp. 1_MG-2023]